MTDDMQVRKFVFFTTLEIVQGLKNLSVFVFLHENNLFLKFLFVSQTTRIHDNLFFNALKQYLIPTYIIQ